MSARSTKEKKKGSRKKFLNKRRVFIRKFQHCVSAQVFDHSRFVALTRWDEGWQEGKCSI